MKTACHQQLQRRMAENGTSFRSCFCGDSNTVVAARTRDVATNCAKIVASHQVQDSRIRSCALRSRTIVRLTGPIVRAAKAENSLIKSVAMHNVTTCAARLRERRAASLHLRHPDPCFEILEVLTHFVTKPTGKGRTRNTTIYGPH